MSRCEDRLLARSLVGGRHLILSPSSWQRLGSLLTRNSLFVAAFQVATGRRVLSSWLLQAEADRAFRMLMPRAWSVTGSGSMMP